ncbi:hypothetical protein E4U38_001207 [Claviceps purpurea]|nr:hypothetical protein E4U38_001207 [Claviceps purpurea]KAG6152187.1 hypothetical protein E4U51_000482 [Claviceps purpurea]
MYQTVTAPGETETAVQVITLTEQVGGVFTQTVTVPGGPTTTYYQSTMTVQNTVPTSTVVVTQNTGAPPVVTAAARSNKAPGMGIFVGVLGALMMI